MRRQEREGRSYHFKPLHDGHPSLFSFLPDAMSLGAFRPASNNRTRRRADRSAPSRCRVTSTCVPLAAQPLASPPHRFLFIMLF